MKHLTLALLVSLFPAFAFPAPSLDQVRAERNLEKRSDQALAYAEKVLKDARKAYDQGDMETVAARLAEVREAVDLSLQSLEETGKEAHKRPKHFKRAEIKTRQLLKQLDAFDRQMSFADRDLLNPVRTHLREVNSDLLLSIMGTKQ
ncbi:MAG: hypothetical protein IPM24_25875 [Bryobacterales bacterium]|nr:hypothetical protein [Bryobacterales bacterium]